MGKDMIPQPNYAYSGTKYGASNENSGTHSARWILVFCFMLVLFFVFLIGFISMSGGTCSKAAAACGRTLAVATMGFHSVSGTISTYVVTGVTTTAVDVVRNATIINIVDCILITDTVMGNDVQRIKTIRNGIYALNMNVVFSSNVDALVTVTMSVQIPDTTLEPESIPFAQVTAEAGNVYSLSISNQLPLLAGSTCNFVMSTDVGGGGADLTIISWDVNLTETKAIVDFTTS